MKIKMIKYPYTLSSHSQTSVQELLSDIITPVRKTREFPFANIDNPPQMTKERNAYYTDLEKSPRREIERHHTPAKKATLPTLLQIPRARFRELPGVWVEGCILSCFSRLSFSSKTRVRTSYPNCGYSKHIDLNSSSASARRV